MHFFAFTSILPAITLLILLSSDQAFRAVVPIVRRGSSSEGTAKDLKNKVKNSFVAMPSAKFTFPKNGGAVASNKPLTINMAIQNHKPGNFINAKPNYFPRSAPQQLDNQGVIHGHSHVIVETLTPHTQTTPTDPKTFAVFKGLKKPALKAA